MAKDLKLVTFTKYDPWYKKKQVIDLSTLPQINA